MSQVSIREYDAKHMWASYSQLPYDGCLIQNNHDIDTLHDYLEKSPHSSFVIKPDQLFGKRAHHKLIGIDLDAQGVIAWLTQHQDKEVTLEGKTDILHTFLVEPYIAHTTEYYVSIRTIGLNDIISFSSQGGTSIESNIQTLQTLSVDVLQDLTHDMVAELSQSTNIADQTQLNKFVYQLFSFFREYGCSSLEINPCVVHDNQVICLDMVAKIDNCEGYRQSHHRKDIAHVAPFGTHHSQIEQTVEELDRKTGASLKLHVLNPHGRLWMILGGGGASVVVMDSLTELGLTDQIANYGELSGNPERNANKEYAMVIIQEMLKSTASEKHLLIVGGISNFTKIDQLFHGIVDAIEIHHKEMKKQGISLLVRRGGIHDQEGLSLIRLCCEKHTIPVVIMNGENYLTDIFGKLSL